MAALPLASVYVLRLVGESPHELLLHTQDPPSSLCIDQKNEYLFERGDTRGDDSGMEDFMSKISSMFKEGSGSVS